MRRSEPIPGVGGEMVTRGATLPRELYDVVMVSVRLLDGKPTLTLLAADDYDNPHQILAEVVFNKAIFDYLKMALDAIDRETLG